MKTDCLKKYFTALPALVLVCVFLFSGCSNVQTTLTASSSPTPSPSPSLSSETPTSAIKYYDTIPKDESGTRIYPEGLFIYGDNNKERGAVCFSMKEFKNYGGANRGEKVSTFGRIIPTESFETLAKKLINRDFTNWEIETMDRYFLAEYDAPVLFVPNPYSLLKFECNVPESWGEGICYWWQDRCEMYYSYAGCLIEYWFPLAPVQDRNELPILTKKPSVEGLKNYFSKAESVQEVEYKGLPAIEFRTDKNHATYYHEYTVDGQTYYMLVSVQKDGEKEYFKNVQWCTFWEGNIIHIERESSTSPKMLQDFYNLRVGSKSE